MSEEKYWKYGPYLFTSMQIVLIVALGIVLWVPFFLTGEIDLGIVFVIIILAITLIYISILKRKYIKKYHT